MKWARQYPVDIASSALLGVGRYCSDGCWGRGDRDNGLLALPTAPTLANGMCCPANVMRALSICLSPCQSASAGDTSG